MSGARGGFAEIDQSGKCDSRGRITMGFVTGLEADNFRLN